MVPQSSLVAESPDVINRTNSVASTVIISGGIPRALESEDVSMDASYCHEVIQEVNPDETYYQDIAQRFFDKKLSYPSNTYRVEKIVRGVKLTDENMETLKPNQDLDDNMINAFFKLLQDVAAKNDFNLLSIDSLMITSLKDGGKFGLGFEKYSKSEKLWTYNLWLIPVYDSDHWTLLVINFRHRQFLYLYSMHGHPPKNWIQRYQTFIELYVAPKFESYSWTE